VITQNSWLSTFKLLLPLWIIAGGNIAPRWEYKACRKLRRQSLKCANYIYFFKLQSKLMQKNCKIESFFIVFAVW